MKKEINVGDTKGLVRRTDDLGRIVIPSEYRKQLGIKEQDEVAIFLLEKGMYIEKLEQ